MKVWIDQDLCTGDGLCEEIVGEVFALSDDGLAYVKGIGEVTLKGADGEPLHKGASGQVDFPDALSESVAEAAAECPGECIFIEQ